MTTLDHIERVRKLARSAMNWEAQDATPPKVCTCPTCGVVNYRLRAELMRRGWSKAAAHHVHIESCETPEGHVAVVKVNDQPVHYVHYDLAEALAAPVTEAIEKELHKRC